MLSCPYVDQELVEEVLGVVNTQETKQRLENLCWHYRTGVVSMTLMTT